MFYLLIFFFSTIPVAFSTSPIDRELSKGRVPAFDSDRTDDIEMDMDELRFVKKIRSEVSYLH